jgi:hypothetical protein
MDDRRSRGHETMFVGLIEIVKDLDMNVSRLTGQRRSLFWRPCRSHSLAAKLLTAGTKTSYLMD